MRLTSEKHSATRRCSVSRITSPNPAPVHCDEYKGASAQFCREAPPLNALFLRFDNSRCACERLPSTLVDVARSKGATEASRFLRDVERQ
jgi:hypothetical protein